MRQLYSGTGINYNTPPFLEDINSTEPIQKSDK